MDSPNQNVTGIPVTSITFTEQKLSLSISTAGITYEGELKTDSIVGIFKQSGLSLPLTLKREPVEIKPVVRPQEPKPPYPYRSEDITFENKSAGITLAGTLTMPATGDNFTAVVLISGSGLQNRDSEIMGHKPFLLIADYLTRHGIAVLRFDDRGMAQSTGDPRTATTADFATDVESAIAYLTTRKEINPARIGLIGHSEGGVIAPMIAARSNDVGFIVMLAGSGIRGDKLLLLQNEQLGRASGMSEVQLTQAKNLNSKTYNKIVDAKEAVSIQEMTDFLTSMKDELAHYFPEGASIDDFIKNTATAMTIPWMQYFLRYDPAPVLEKVQCPVYAINGSKDLQVPAKENLTAISEALKKGGNTNFTIKEYPGLNHLFQECTTGLPAEYATIEQTISPTVLKDLTEWISNN
jgi:pimeloyl-ACP methyl ester carboxylesterase